MFRQCLCVAIGLMAVLVAWNLGGTEQARAEVRHHTTPDLFYNYYVPSGGGGGAGAQLYLSPRPTPPLVGHTYITYQPLMPHEFLYPHCRQYVRCHPCGGSTRTTVVWTRDLLDLGQLLRSPRPVNAAPLCRKLGH